jgi:peptidoglycan hydrolase-like protein with peptidoglycan-binding domain
VKRRRRLAAGFVGVVAVAAVVAAGLLISPRLGPPSTSEGTGKGVASATGTGTGPPAARLVAVTRTTLVASQPVSGTVTSTQAWTIAFPTGASPDDVATAEDAVAAANNQLVVARTEVPAATRARTLVAARDDAVVAAAPPGAPRREAVRTRSLDRIDQDRAVATAQGALADARRALAAATRDLAARRSAEVSPGRTVTSLPALGTTVARGETLYAIDGQPTVLLIGTVPGYRALREGDTGPDVAQLQANLVALGAGGSPALRTDGTFDHATTVAVQRWQTIRHVAATGILRLGDAIVLPAAVRVATAHVAIGGAALPGGPMLDLTSVDEIVKLAVDPHLAPSIHAGDQIRFTTTDGTAIPGRIVSVAAVAVAPPETANGPPAGPSVEVIAAATDPAALADLDGTDLLAAVTTGTAPDALAVPVEALVVLADGSFGVEVADGGTTHFVQVVPGIYDQTMVEIKATGIAPGDQVVVPA